MAGFFGSKNKAKKMTGHRKYYRAARRTGVTPSSSNHRDADAGGDVSSSTTVPPPVVKNNEPRTEQVSFTSLVNMKKEKASLGKQIRNLYFVKEYNKNEGASMILGKSENPIITEICASQSEEEKIKLNIGGQTFITTKKTLNQRENMLKVMINSEFPIDKDENGCIVITDRNPHYFPIILEHIRTGTTKYCGLNEDFPTEESLLELRNLLEESDYFGTQKLSNIVALKIKQDRKLLSNGKPPEKKKEEKQYEIESKLSSRDLVYLTKEEKERFDTYVNDLETELVKLRKQLEELNEKIEKPIKKFNVRGVVFDISIEKLISRDSLLTTLCRERRNDEEIFIDRDSATFGILMDCFNSEDFSPIPKEAGKRKQLYNLAKDLNVRFLLDYLDPVRFPFELMGENNRKIKEKEDFIRDMFNNPMERSNPILQDPKLHLIEFFKDDACEFVEKRELPPSVYPLFDFENEKEAEELCKRNHVKKPPIPQICNSQETFQKQFDAFTCFLLKDLNWDNIVCAGGSVLNCLLLADEQKDTKTEKMEVENNTYIDPNEKPYWTEDDESNEEVEVFEDSDYFTSSGDEEFSGLLETKTIKKKESPEQILYRYYRNNFRKSDIDIFLYDMNEKQATEKIVYIYEYLKKQLNDIPTQSFLKETYHAKSELNDITIIKTDNAITFSLHPNFRKFQIILRIYKSLPEILIGFDVNSCCVGYDGKNVYGLPRAIQSFSTNCNIVDPDRQSTTYETRLVKYALRGFRIGIPGFEEHKICNKLLNDPNGIKQNNDWWGYTATRNRKKLRIDQVTGLARLLLIRNAMKNCNRKSAAWWSIGGGFTLEQAQKKLNVPSAPYEDITSGFHSHSTPKDIYRKLSNKLYNIQGYTRYPTRIKVKINDIKGIVDPSSTSKKNKNKQENKLEFITNNPGTQSVGSFFPHTRNFFQDAYVNQNRLKKSKNTYLWREGTTTFSKELSKTIEKKYRHFLKSRNIKDSEFPLPDDKDGRYIDFRNFYVVTPRKGGGKTFGSVAERFKNNNRIIPRIKQIEQVDHQAVLFGEESNSEDEKPVEEGSVLHVNHRYARPENSRLQYELSPYPNMVGATIHDDSDDEDDEDEHHYHDEDYGDNDDDYEDYDDDDDEGDFNPEAFQRMMMMNAALMREHGPPSQCKQQ